MYILVSLAEFIFLIFRKGSEAVISSIIFPNGNSMYSYDNSPAIDNDIPSHGANCLCSTTLTSEKSS